MKLLTVLILAVCISKAPAKQEADNSNVIPSTDICQTKETDEQIHCFCDQGGDPKVVKIECWIVGGNLTQDYNYWKLLHNQPHVKSLRMMVKPRGNLTFLPQRVLTHLEELQKFEISHATIDDIPSHTFANMSALTLAKLDRNQIASIAANAFAHLPNLTEVNLDENRVRELRRGVFVDVPALHTLFITRNNMSIIHDGAFEHLHNLSELELSGNDISVLTKDTFLGLANLRKLDLGFNSVSMLGDYTFSETPMLEDLLLESNNIQLITEKAFTGLGNLRKLILSHNKITSLPSRVFEGVPNLFYLDLKTNFLDTLTYETMRPILDNLINTTSYFLVDVNQFTCDCRLAWIHRLHNQTESNSIRGELESMLCRFARNETEPEDSVKVTTMLPSAKGSDSDDVEYEYEYYDELQGPSDTSRLLQIPLNELPCTQDELASEELRQIMNVPKDSVNSIGIPRPDLYLIAVIACAVCNWI